MVQPPLPPVPLSRPTAVENLPDHGLRLVVRPEAAERDALARLNGLVGLPSIEATFLLRREAKGGVWVTGNVTAEVIQTCVVSLDQFSSAIDEAIDVHFLPEDALTADREARAKRSPDPSDDEDETDEPDPIVAGSIDIGLLTAEYLSLGIDPYPKKPGVRFEAVDPPEEGTKPTPFAVLKALRPDER